MYLSIKKIYFLIVFSIFLFVGEKISAQSFTFVNHDTTKCGAVSSDIECYVGDSIVNNSASVLTLDVVRVEDDTATAGWTSAFCLATCFLPNKDSVRLTLQPNKSQGITIHFYTSAVPGNGTVRFKVKDIHSPSTAVYQRYYGSSTCTGINEPFVNSTNATIYPSPLIAGNDFNMNITNVQNGNKEISLLVYSIYGSIVSRINNLKEGKNTLNINLPTGIYFYSLISGGVSIYSDKMAIEKTAH